MNTNDNMRDDIENDRVENESDETINTTAQAGKQKRHRSRNKDINTWQKNVRKRCQSGLDYMNSRGKHVAAKRTRIRKDCKGKCRKQCSWHITNDEIRGIHSYFWSLTDDQKLTFYADTTERLQKGTRKTTRQNVN